MNEEEEMRAVEMGPVDWFQALPPKFGPSPFNQLFPIEFAFLPKILWKKPWEARNRYPCTRTVYIRSGKNL